MGKVIYWKLCKKFKFDHINKWYVHNTESFLENKMPKPLWGFEIQTNHLISAKPPYLEIATKKKGGEKEIYRIVDFAVLVDHTVKLKESEKRDKKLDLARELKKKMKHESGSDTNCN